jgi:hypothetical protein
MIIPPYLREKFCEKDLTHSHGEENGWQFHLFDRKNGSGIEKRNEKVPKFLPVVAT